MRDPEGSLQVRGDDLIRLVNAQSAARSFLRLPLAAELQQLGLLVPFTEISDTELKLQKILFVSAPFEWCDAQLRSAADLTLDISSRVRAAGYELKDAACWNVIFDGCRPVFCDHLSFQPITTRQWWAFGQFLRHFVFPLQVSHTTGLRAARLFRLSRDGLQAAETRRLLGWRRYFTRVWPLLMLGDKAATRTPARNVEPATGNAGGLHANLYSFCAWSLAKHAPPRRSDSVWIDYTATRTHYAEDTQQQKQQTVSEWLDTTRPARLIDYGANTGEYTQLAVAKGISVVAIEQDHECVTRIFRESGGNPLIAPVFSNLGDLCGGAGWLGTEHSSLFSRLRNHANMVLMLAVIHHLAISESIPLDLIADLAADTTRDYAIIEFIAEADPMVQTLAAQRSRDISDFSMVRQLAAFKRRFHFVAERELTGTGRRLVLMRKISA